MNQYDADGATMGFRSSEEFSAYLETAQKQKQATTNNQTNERTFRDLVDGSGREELIRRLRHIEGTTPTQLITDCDQAAALLEADAQRPAMNPLTDERIAKAWSVAEGEHNASASVKRRITRAIEAAHCIK